MTTRLGAMAMSGHPTGVQAMARRQQGQAQPCPAPGYSPFNDAVVGVRGAGLVLAQLQGVLPEGLQVTIHLQRRMPTGVGALTSSSVRRDTSAHYLLLTACLPGPWPWQRAGTGCRSGMTTAPSAAPEPVAAAGCPEQLDEAEHVQDQYTVM